MPLFRRREVRVLPGCIEIAPTGMWVSVDTVIDSEQQTLRSKVCEIRFATRADFRAAARELRCEPRLLSAEM